MTTVDAIYKKSAYKTALKKAEELMAGHPEKRTVTYDEFDMVGTLAYAYEDIHYPVEYKAIKTERR